MTPVPDIQSIHIDEEAIPKKQRFPRFFAAALILIAVTAALLGGMFTLRRTKDGQAEHSAAKLSLTTTPTAKPEAPPDTPREENKIVNEINAPSNDRIDEAPAEPVIAESAGEPEEAQPEEASTKEPVTIENNTGPSIRFPGTYVKGEIHPEIKLWGNVDRIFKRIRSCKGKIVISGHTCSMGDEDANQIVSRRRAEIVYGYFVKRGFSRRRLMVEGMGASMPIADNETEEGRIKNRRVDISCR